MEPFSGYRQSQVGSSVLGSTSARNAGVMSNAGMQAFQARERIREAKDRAEQYAKSASREADSVRNQGLMSGITSAISGAASMFKGAGAGGIGREMSKIGKAGYTLPSSLSGPSGFDFTSSFLG